MFATRFRLTCHMIGVGFNMEMGFFELFNTCVLSIFVQLHHIAGLAMTLSIAQLAHGDLNTFALVEPYELKHGAAVSHPCASGSPTWTRCCSGRL